MPMTRAHELAYTRVRVPDLEVAERFFSDLGLLVAERTENALYLRGTGSARHVQIVEKGEAKFVAHAYYAETEEDLHHFAALPGASPVEVTGEPGGGKRVRLTDPDGNGVEVVHGFATVEPVKLERFPINCAADGLRRAGTLTRHVRGPAHVLRIGHTVLASMNTEAMLAWYRNTLGLVRSDDAVDVDGNLVLAFNRLDHGKEYVDHHVLLIQRGKNGVNHIAFEVQDLDDLMLGHEHMLSRERDRVWGIGRHVYGSQIFSYWMDPFGFMYEMWTDSDRLNSDHQPVAGTLESADGPWGDQVPQRFFTHVHD